MTFVTILFLTALVGVVLGVRDLRRDPRTRGTTPPRSHRHESAPAPWYATGGRA